MIPSLVEEVARLVMEEGKMKDCLKTNGLEGEFNDDHTVLQWEMTQHSILRAHRILISIYIVCKTEKGSIYTKL